MFSLSSVATVTTVTVVADGDDDGRQLVHIALFSALEQTHCGAAFVAACDSTEMSDCRLSE